MTIYKNFFKRFMSTKKRMIQLIYSSVVSSTLSESLLFAAPLLLISLDAELSPPSTSFRPVPLLLFCDIIPLDESDADPLLSPSLKVLLLQLLFSVLFVSVSVLLPVDDASR